MLDAVAGVQASASRPSRSRSSARRAPTTCSRNARQGLPARRVLVGAGDADHPAARVRRARRRRAAGAARVLRRAGDDRPRRRSPATSFAAGDATQSVILLIGMAVGVDYSLFYIRREREERARGAGHREALLRTAATSGHAVLISGLTVMIAMAGMLLHRQRRSSRRSRVGAMLMVAVALIGSLSILPALLSKLGDRVNKGRHPAARAAARRASRGSGTRCSTRCCGGRWLSAIALGGARCSRSHCRRSACTRSCRASPTCRSRSRSCAPTSAIQKAFPGRADAGRGRRQGARRDRAAGAGGRSPSSSGSALATRRDVKQPIDVEVNPDEDGRDRVDSRCRATATTRASVARARRRCAAT